MKKRLLTDEFSLHRSRVIKDKLKDCGCGPQAAQVECEAITCPPKCAVSIKRDPCKSVTCITKQMFCKDKNGLIISHPGVYKLAENIKFKPHEQRTTALTITASNVILDLGSHTLKQGNNTQFVYGIAICRDVKNVKITGVIGVASVLNFTLAGIRVFGRTDTITIENVIVSQTVTKELTNDQIPANCSDILCLNMNVGIIVGEGDTGYISMKGTDKANLVTNLTIGNVTAKRSVIGCHIVFTFGIKVYNSSFIENTYYGLLIGFSWLILNEDGTQTFPTAADGTITDSHFDRNVGTNHASLSNPQDTFNFDFISGLAFNGVRTFEVTDCTVNDNASDSFILALDHDGCNNMTYRNCVAKRTRSETFVGDGIHFSGSIANTIGPCVTGNDFPFNTNFNIVLDNCIAEDTFAGFRAAGMRFAFVDGAVIKNCVSTGNKSGPDGTLSAGFRVQGLIPGGISKNITFDNCVAESNSAEGNAIAAGFVVHNVSRNVILRDCIANGNGNNTSGVPSIASAGIIVTVQPLSQLEDVQGVVIDHCITNGNGTIFAPLSAGILLWRPNALPPIDRVLIQKSTSTYNIGDGIAVNGDITRVTIKANEADNNTGIGFNIVDPNPVVVAKNVAVDNGGGNYVGVPANDIVVGTIGNLPLAVGFKNVSITI